MSQKNRPLFIAITGDIASGKSTVSRYFQDNDYMVIYADFISGAILHENSDHVCELMGMELYDRKRLRSIIFSDCEKLAKLEKFLHPKIILQLQSFIDCYDDGGEDIVFFEIPLLFECKLQKGFDLSLLITADYKDKIKRIIERDGCKKKEAEAIIKKQLPQEEKVKLADVIINNIGDLDVFYGKLEIFSQMMKYIPKRKLKRLCK